MLELWHVLKVDAVNAHDGCRHTRNRTWLTSFCCTEASSSALDFNQRRAAERGVRLGRAFICSSRAQFSIGGVRMEQILINLIAGAAGRGAAGKASPQFDLGMIENLIQGRSAGAFSPRS